MEAETESWGGTGECRRDDVQVRARYAVRIRAQPPSRRRFARFPARVRDQPARVRTPICASGKIATRTVAARRVRRD